MKLRILVELIDNGKTTRKMRVIEVPMGRVRLVEMMHGEHSSEFILDEALTSVSEVFQARQKADVVDPKAAPKKKLDEILGLGIIEEMDRKEQAPCPGGGQAALPPLPRVGVPPPPSPRLSPGPVGFGAHRGK